MNIEQPLPDFFSKFKEIVFEIDTKNSLEDKKNYLFKEIDLLRECLVALESSENYIGLGTMLKVMEQFDLNSTITFFNSAPSNALCKKFNENNNEINKNLAKITFARSCKLYENAKIGKKIKKYLDRHRFLETAIRLVWELFPADDNAAWPYSNIEKNILCKFIAKCYLLRSKLALPKGSDIPEKKLEAIQKALDWFEKSDSKIDDLKIEIILEKIRWEKQLSKEWIIKILNEFFDNITFDPKNDIHRAVLDRASEFKAENFNKKLDELNNSVITITLPESKNLLWLPLHQAKASIANGNNNLDIRIKHVAQALSGVPLSYQLWDDTVAFIKKLHEKDIKGWDDLAISAWEICMQEEARLKLSVQVRWYWARQAELYDLAFKAAIYQKNPERAAHIADSLKSRPAVKLIQAENSIYKQDKKTIEEFRVIETNYAVGNFQTGLEEAKKWKSGLHVNESTILSVPKGCTAIHFYISLDNSGYAITIDDDNKKIIHKIKIEKIWNAYKDWKKELQKERFINYTSSALNKLCEICGEILKPVFDKINPAKKIIIIPYGFLHLVPLHATLIDKAPLFITKICFFLPAWTLIPKKIKKENKGCILLTNWQNNDNLEKFIKHEKWDNDKVMECTPDDCIKILKNKTAISPKLLTFYCHGQGNYMNPYNSALKMYGKHLTHQMIVHETEKDTLNGTKVILTACESDLASGNNDITDEHLSLASAFLQKGASEICGTLFECLPDVAGDIITEALENLQNSKNPTFSLSDTLHNVQKKLFDKEKPGDLYKIAAFRIIGFHHNIS